MLTVINYADDRAITADNMTNATVLLLHVENTDKDVEIYVNASKRE